MWSGLEPNVEQLDDFRPNLDGSESSGESRAVEKLVG